MPYGHGVDCQQIESSRRPIPYPIGPAWRRQRRILDLAEDLGPDDLALCLISGGGSALLTFPAPGWTLEDKRRVTSELIRSGASIR